METSTALDATEFTDALSNLIFDLGGMDTDDVAADALPLVDAQVSTFAEAGVLTSNDGLVIRLADGSEFQVTVVQSR